MEKTGNTAEKFLILLIVFIIGALLFKFQTIALLFFSSFIISSALNPVVDWLNKRLNRTLSVILVYAFVFMLFLLVLIPLSSVIYSQMYQLIQQIPSIWDNFTDFAAKSPVFRKSLSRLPDISQVSGYAGSVGGNIINSSINFTLNFFSGLVIVFTLAMIILYMLMDKMYLREKFLRFFPEEKRERVKRISDTIAKKVGGYVIGQMIAMAVIAVFTSIGFMLIGLNFSVLLGILAGILDIIPVLGPAITITLAALVALSQKPILILWAVLVFGVVQWIVDTFLKPYIFGKFLNLHPLTIIFSLLICAFTLGIVGIVLAPAIAATVCVLIDELYLNKINKK